MALKLEKWRHCKQPLAAKKQRPFDKGMSAGKNIYKDALERDQALKPKKAPRISGAL